MDGRWYVDDFLVGIVLGVIGVDRIVVVLDFVGVLVVFVFIVVRCST